MTEMEKIDRALKKQQQQSVPGSKVMIAWERCKVVERAEQDSLRTVIAQWRESNPA
jgi:hypothetical protein